jgi:hypothetical protein
MISTLKNDRPSLRRLAPNWLRVSTSRRICLKPTAELDFPPLSRDRLARLIQRIAEIQKRQLYKALSPHKDPVSRPLHSPDRREFRFVHTLWSPKPAAVRLCLR